LSAPDPVVEQAEPVKPKPKKKRGDGNDDVV
jgi:hypothetical protein